MIRADNGFAPHIDAGGSCLSLACCKPKIRKSAQVGDWVVGIGGLELSKRCGEDVAGRLVYAAQIDETLDFNSYYNDPRFANRADNIYHRTGDGTTGWEQDTNPFHSSEHVSRDTGVDRVLVSHHFLYFGSNGPMMAELGEKYLSLVKRGQGHKKVSLVKKSVAGSFVHLLSKSKFSRRDKPAETKPTSGSCSECDG